MSKDPQISARMRQHLEEVAARDWSHIEHARSPRPPAPPMRKPMSGPMNISAMHVDGGPRVMPETIRAWSRPPVKDLRVAGEPASPSRDERPPLLPYAGANVTGRACREPTAEERAAVKTLKAQELADRQAGSRARAEARATSPRSR